MKVVKKMYLTCEICNKSNSERISERKAFDFMIMCEACYKSHIKYPFDHIPPAGEVHYDSEGRVLCHECGRGFHKLTVHITQAHNMTQQEYKEKHGLNRQFKLTSEKAKEIYRKDSNLSNLKSGRINIQNINYGSLKGKTRRLQYTKGIERRKEQD